jgi:hypothetical protein
MKKLIILSLTTLLFIASCQPSAAATETAATQPQPTNIPSNQCTDRGWADIVNYLYEFDQVVTDADMKADVSILVDQLENIKKNIKEVGIDNCTESARKSVISGLDNRIKGMQYMASGDQDAAFNYIHYGNRLLILAKDELKNYGIALKYPNK